MRLDGLLTMPRIGAALLAVVCGVSFSAAQRLKPNPPGQPASDAKAPARQPRPAPDLANDPVLVEAAKTAPAPPDSLVRLVPEKVGAFARKDIHGQLQQMGPALFTEVRGQFEGPSGNKIDLLMVDSAGLASHTRGGLAPIAPGKRVVDHDFVREGFKIDGFPAILEDGGPQGARRIQVQVSPRLRITVDSPKATRDDLVAAVRAIDLRAAAALTTTKAAAPATTPAPQE